MMFGTIDALAHAACAYFKFKTSREALDSLREVTDERDKIESELIELSVRTGIHADVRAGLIAIHKRKLQQHQQHVRSCAERLASSTQSDPPSDAEGH